MGSSQVLDNKCSYFSIFFFFGRVPYTTSNCKILTLHVGTDVVTSHYKM